MTHQEAEAAKRLFATAWNARRAAPLSAPEHEQTRIASNIQVITFFNHRLRVWTEHLDKYSDLEHALLLRVFELRTYFKVDMRLRAIMFVEPDLRLYEIAEIEPSGPLKPWITMNALVTDPPPRKPRKRAAPVS